MNDKGFTLVETLVVLAITSVITIGSLLVFQQIVLGTGRSNSQNVVLSDVNQAALAIKKDLQMAQETNLTDGDPIPRNNVLLSWIDYTGFQSENNTAHSSNYTLSGKALLRNYDGTTSIVGRNISYLGFQLDGNVVDVTITATSVDVPIKSETLLFSVMMRSEEAED